jgi:hypothetical protein
MSTSLGEWPRAAQEAGKKFSGNWQEFFQKRGAEATQEIQDILEASKVAEAQKNHEAELLRLQNVVGVAGSFKVKKNRPTSQHSLTVFVREKKSAGQLPKSDVVPQKVDDVLTDVVEVGDLEALVFNARVRPALPGFSIGHHNITAGTFGCLVRDIRRCCEESEADERGKPGHTAYEGEYLILSNNHVLANINQGKPGDLILQPGPFDGGVFPADGIATLKRYEPIVFGLSGYNIVDAAVAEPTHSRNVVAAIIGLVIPRGVGQALPGGLVVKAGRTTQVTIGFVLATNATVVVGYGAAGTAQFRNQIITTAMSAGGDSGSLLMDANLNAVGLLFAGSPFITIHNNIANVEVALGVRPVTAPRFS